MPGILLNGPMGRLEAHYTHNNQSNSPTALILHAHPGHGGNMNNPLSLKLHKLFSTWVILVYDSILEELENLMANTMEVRVN